MKLSVNLKYKKGTIVNNDDIINLFKKYNERIIVELKEKGVYENGCERMIVEIKVKSESEIKPKPNPVSKSECPKSPNGKHEYIPAPDSFELPYCKHCYKTN